MTEVNLITPDEVAQMTGSPTKFVIQTLDRDGIEPVAVSGGWLKSHKVTNLRWRRADIAAWVERQRADS